MVLYAEFIWWGNFIHQYLSCVKMIILTYLIKMKISCCIFSWVKNICNSFLKYYQLISIKIGFAFNLILFLSVCILLWLLFSLQKSDKETIIVLCGFKSRDSDWVLLCLLSPSGKWGWGNPASAAPWLFPVKRGKASGMYYFVFSQHLQ